MPGSEKLKFFYFRSKTQYILLILPNKTWFRKAYQLYLEECLKKEKFKFLNLICQVENRINALGMNKYKFKIIKTEQSKLTRKELKFDKKF